MRWRNARRSDNVSESTGGGRSVGFRPIHGISLTGLVVILGIGWIFGINPLQMLGMLGGSDGGNGASETATTRPARTDTDEKAFVSVVLASTEDVWSQVFTAAGKTYADPKLVLYQGYVPTACGTGQSAMGPFYCPGDQTVYLDMGFFQEMDKRFQASGDFARAYVIAHEVGHHVQNLLGIFGAVEQARRQGQPMQGAGGLSVRQELQADCFAGVWANKSEQQNHWLDPGDIQAAMHAASAVGDDALQKQSRGHVVPDSFTHGTSAQRERWFDTGFKSGNINQCDTFGAATL